MTSLCNASTVSTLFTHKYIHTLAQTHTERQPTPSTSPTMPFPTANPPEGTTSSPPPPPPGGTTSTPLPPHEGTTSSPPPPPGDTTSPPPPPPGGTTSSPLPPHEGTTSSPPPPPSGGMPSTPATEPLDVEYIITICVPAGLGVIVIIAVLGFTGCVTVCCVRRRRHCQIERKADKLKKEVNELVEHLSNNTAKRRIQEALIDDKRQQIDCLQNQARENYRIANELREKANRIQTEVTELYNSNLKKRKREKVIKAKEKEIKSLLKQASILSGEDYVDGDVELDRGEDEENVFDATCRSRTNPHANGRTDYATVDGSIHIEIPEEVLFKESCL